MVVLLLLLAAFLPSAVVFPGTAHATFHLVSIGELGVGFLDDPDVQFVELRLDAAGQTRLTDTRLTVFDKDGIATELLLTPADVAHGASGATVLYATAAFQAKTGISPDFVIPVGIVQPSGMVCWGAPGAVAPDPPGSWDLAKPENYVDCVAYGSYPHMTRPGSGAPSTLGPGDGVRSLTRIKNTGAAGGNDMDFALADATPCTNANACADLDPAPALGKAERTCRRAVVRATTSFAGVYLQALAACETSRLKGKLTGSCPDAKAAGRIAAAEAKRTKVVVKACGASPAAAAGFGGSCPGYTAGCQDAIVGAADVSGCVGCGARRASDEIAATLYAAAADPALLKCQLALGTAVVSHARATARLRARCEDAVLRDKLPGPCPDAKTAGKLAAKSAKLRRALCKACGGKDKQCDGIADASPAALGLTACPARTVPGGATCGGIGVGDLAGVVACVECVADFSTTCTTTLAARASALPLVCAAP